VKSVCDGSLTRFRQKEEKRENGMLRTVKDSFLKIYKSELNKLSSLILCHSDISVYGVVIKEGVSQQKIALLT
jgi:hypothetical protein